MTQSFRDFFRSGVIGATEGIAVLDVTLVFADLKGSTALYERKKSRKVCVISSRLPDKDGAK